MSEEMHGQDLEDVWRNSPEKFTVDSSSSLESLYSTDHVSDKSSFIQKTAEQICMLQSLNEGDKIRVTSTNYEDGGFTLHYRGAEEAEGGNYVYGFDSEEHTEIQIVIDFEGAYTSIIDYYVPYVTAIIVGGGTLGDIETMKQL